MPLAGVTNRRSMIYLYNLTDLIITCIMHPKAAGKTFLASDGEDVSTAELIKYISIALGRHSRLFRLVVMQSSHCWKYCLWRRWTYALQLLLWL